MDTIILAAGENVRLQAAGIPPGKKPLLYREGEVLVRRLCRQALENASRFSPGSRLVVVTNPSNTDDIAFATREFSPRIVVQLDAIGPTHAVDLGLEVTKSHSIMLLMADNFIKHWRTNHGFAPSVCVTTSDDHALHPIDTDGFFTDDQHSRIRWLGPLTFHKEMYTLEAKSWLEAFDNIQFTMHEQDGIEDMGVLP